MVYTNLSNGSKGDNVKKLQTALVNAGYSVGSAGVDGIYGKDTQAAVKKYQQDNGMNASGVADDAMLTKLYTPASTGTPQTDAAPQNPTVPNRYDPVSDDAYQQALSVLQAASDNTPSYSGTYDGQLQELYDQIVNRPKFSYDINSDMLYNQYVQQYQQMGKMAMNDTMGQAAALTGGYGSSYGQAVGQQQYDAYLQRLNDAIPELYGMAYDRYNDETDALLKQYSMLGDMRDEEYGRYQDAYSKWYSERAYAQEQADQAYQRGYNSWSDDYSIAEKRAAMLADSGDFTGYAELYGDNAASSMQASWIYSNPDLAYRNGLIDAKDYKSITGKYPAGYSSGSSNAAKPTTEQNVTLEDKVTLEDIENSYNKIPSRTSAKATNFLRDLSADVKANPDSYSFTSSELDDWARKKHI